MKTTLTNTQRELLRAVVADFRAQLKQELRRWGREAAKLMAARPFVVPHAKRLATVRALIRDGYVTDTWTVAEVSELRRMPFGRGYWGTRTHKYAQIRLRPTTKGMLAAR